MSQRFLLGTLCLGVCRSSGGTLQLGVSRGSEGASCIWRAPCDGSDGKESACNAGDLVQPLGREDPLEKGMETHSSIPAWEIPWTEGSGELQSMGSQRVGHDWVTNTSTLPRCLCRAAGTWKFLFPVTQAGLLFLQKGLILVWVLTASRYEEIVP